MKSGKTMEKRRREIKKTTREGNERKRIRNEKWARPKDRNEKRQEERKTDGKEGRKGKEFREKVRENVTWR